MIRRLYIDNYRCFRNFELKLDKLPCAMIIGANGVGKSTLSEVLSIFHTIGCGEANVNVVIPRDVRRVGAEAELAEKSDKRDVVTLELEVGDGDDIWIYTLRFAPFGFGYRVVEEVLSCDGERLFDRATLPFSEESLGLAVASGEQGGGKVGRFKQHLAGILVIRPNPRYMTDAALMDDRPLAVDCANFASWLLTLLTKSGDAYASFKDYLLHVIPDFVGLAKSDTTRSGSTLGVRFKSDRPDGYVQMSFSHLSDGEKCQCVAGAVVANNALENNFTCFWDEPDNYITTSEIDCLLPALCHSFVKRGQLIVTSHSREAIKTFGEDEVVCLRRDGHIYPVRPPVTVRELRAGGQISGSLDEALLNGDVIRS